MNRMEVLKEQWQQETARTVLASALTSRAEHSEEYENLRSSRRMIEYPELFDEERPQRQYAKYLVCHPISVISGNHGVGCRPRPRRSWLSGCQGASLGRYPPFERTLRGCLTDWVVVPGFVISARHSSGDPRTYLSACIPRRIPYVHCCLRGWRIHTGWCHLGVGRGAFRVA